MAFPLLAAISSIGGLGSQAAGGAQSAASTLEGAKTQANIEAMNRRFQQEVYDAEQRRLRPYYDAGLRNLPQLLAASRYQNDPMSTAPARAQYSFGQNALAGQGFTDPETLAYLRGNVNDAEREAGYNRLLDLERIGLGASETAGSGAQNYANALSSSFMTGGNAMAAGTQNANTIRRGAYDNALGQASGIPAYMAQQRHIDRQRQPEMSTYGPYRNDYQWGR